VRHAVPALAVSSLCPATLEHRTVADDVERRAAVGAFLLGDAAAGSPGVPKRDVVDLELATTLSTTIFQLAANPIGVFFEPARILEAHRSGQTFADIHKGLMAGKFLPDKIPDLGLPA
jgi:hypothetical protein